MQARNLAFEYDVIRMIGFCPIASGSKGNAILVRSKKSTVLIDAGISCRRIFHALDELKIDPFSIDAILVTHEHTDHIAHLATLAKKINAPVVTNAETAKAIVQILNEKPRFRIFVTGDTFQINDLEITSFSTPHDAIDPVGFVIHMEGKKIGFCADLGHATSLICKKLEACDFLYLESNHQVSMVHACSRPASYKERVLSKQGHLSNDQCAELLGHLAHPNLKQVYLAHLSSECNTPEVALNVVSQKLKDIKLNQIELLIAHQDKISKPVLL